MKIQSRRIAEKYFTNPWVPGAVCLALLGVFTISALFHSRALNVLSHVLLVCVAIAFLGILSAAAWNLAKKRWAKGLGNLGMFLLCGTAAFVAMGFLIFASMMGPSEDGFADDLIMPNNLELAEPEAFDAEPNGARDAFQQSLLAALSTAGGDDPTITADVAMLVRVHQNAPEVLRRYLATSPSWRVFKERGNLFATRRWMVGSKWRYTLHGYYTRHAIDSWSEAGIPDFQFRFTIGFSGKPWAGASRDATRMDAGQTGPLRLSEGNRMHESRCLITVDPLVVELFEQSEAKERRLTKAALSFVANEISPLAAQPTWETIRRILPSDSVRQGAASFELGKSFQSGLYDSRIWVNPGEPGMLYLKAYEVTKGTPLSVDDLKERSNEWVGWSEDPGELFFSNTHFTIFEGDWGKPYAARFEVWFTPDSGGPDRKLMEKVFRIEGWQR
ncbi:MAG: hypothetical protein JXQ73_12115 [Phycisphaerae bacterium]|nr:hypothetical protein [Phycisphaerae bacterium]